MDDVSYFDSTGTCCPVCHGTDRLRYTIIPPSRLIFESADGTENVHHFGEQRDYKCADCDNEWLMDDPEKLTNEEAR